MPPVAAICLAAGRSQRLGRNKLLVEIGGRPLIRSVVENLLSSRARPVLVVTGHEANRVEQALAGSGITIVHNPDYLLGLSASIRTGVKALPEVIDGTLIALGDMPATSPALIGRLIDSFAPEKERLICVPKRNGVRGNPVLFGRRFFPDLLKLSGDLGAKRLLTANEKYVCEVEADDDGPFTDIDTPEALASYRARSQ